MKKLFIIMSLLLCAAFILSGCDGKKDASNATAKTEPTFTVGFDAEFPPYGFFDKELNGYTGFDLELAEAVCKKIGKKLVKKPINWDAKDMELNSGAIDCIWNGFTINGRENDYTFSSPYVDNSQVVLVKANSTIAKIADLKGKIVAAQTDTPILKALQDGDLKETGKSFKQIIVTNNYNNAVMELESGAVEAVAMDIGVAKKKLVDVPGKFKMLDEALMSEKYGIGFKKGNEALRDEIEAAFKAIIKDGTAVEISKKYFDGKNVIILEP